VESIPKPVIYQENGETESAVLRMVESIENQKVEITEEDLEIDDSNMMSMILEVYEEKEEIENVNEGVNEVDGKQPEEIYEIMHECLFCDYKTTDSINLRNHKWSVHGCKRGHYPCDKCSYTGRTVGLLRNHTERLHSEKKFQCEECSHVLSSQFGLQTHIRRSTEKVREKISRAYIVILLQKCSVWL